MFKISDKVVCVDDNNQKNKSIFIDGDCVVKGSVYDVRDVRMLQTGMVVYLTGLCCGYWWDGDEAGFKAIRFRKLEDIKEENRKKQQEPLWEVQPLVEIHDTVGTKWVSNPAYRHG